jgi:hypothetical protein
MKQTFAKIISFSAIVVFLGAIFYSLGGCNRTESASIVSDSLQALLPATVDFNFHVKPILSDRCFACHGPDPNKREANLRLDTEEGAYAAIDSLGERHAIVKGNLDKSMLFQRITSKDPDEVMPPANSNLTLSEFEIAILTRWLEQGAQWKEHWSFIPPDKPEVPKVKKQEWVKNPIDHFVLNRLEQKGLTPAEEAARETLLRRVSFDLTGLPPTIEEVDAFLQDTSPNAYEKAVDRLLASPHYGERMAVEWLDVARYADSHGYQDDGMRNSWPWRDWVINAYNQNLPYDKFITWQLAGDMLPNPTKEQLIATSFNRNHPQTQEGGVVDEEYRVEYVADRTNTFGKAFLGLTVECARCHDHKYDPVSQKDYYSLYAFFNNNNESGIIPYNGEASPTVILTSEDAGKKLDFIREQIAPLQKALEPANYYPDFTQWLATARATPDKFGLRDNQLIGLFHFEEPTEEKEFKNATNTKLKAKVSGDMDKKPVSVPGKAGKGRKLIGDAGIDFTKEIEFDRHQPFSISIWANVLEGGEEGTLFAKCNGEFEGYRGYRVLLNKDNSLSVSFSYVWPANSIDLRIKEKLTPNTWHHLVLTYDGSSKASGVKLFLDGNETGRTVLTDNLHKSILYGEKKSHWSEMPFMIGRDMRGSIQNVMVDEMAVYQRQLSALEVREINGQKGAIAGILKKPATTLSKAEEEQLFEYYLLNEDKTYAGHLAKITRLRDEENQLLTDQPEVMIMQERTKPLQAYILDRGAYDAPKTPVEPATPSRLIALDKKLPKNRLGLSKWLLDPQHPLTSRVTVNRFWAMCFGQGLVSTPDDFGNQGSLPTHPDLLDYLATRFVESGWDTKALMKMMVMSATYRQSSVVPPAAIEADPDNALYSRGPSFRLSAEMIRDNALAASGLLARKIGGPSVYPYQPEGIWEALATRNKTHYEQGKGDDLYRRSLYTVWKRSSPPPSMMNFDAPDRYICIVKRQKTATPLQSLVLMNDPQYVEASRVLAERMIKEGGNTASEKIAFAFKALTSRKPKAAELDLLIQLYEEELADFKKQSKRAMQLLTVGEYRRDTKLEANELAAYTIVASSIMNFDEFVVKR